MSRSQIIAKSKRNPSFAKPFLKWVGGKTQLLDRFATLYPQQLKQGKIDKYFELFLGGGAVFFDVIQQYAIAKVFLNDLNRDLILAYRVIKQNPDRLIELLSKLQQTYYQKDAEERKELFYLIRQDYNCQGGDFDYQQISTAAIQRVSWLIFLNKTCFNGLYRTNKKGDFNVPIGQYKQPKICDRDNLLKIAKLLQNVTLVSGNYNIFEDLIDRQSFVYIDPPYRPIDRTSNFTAYAKSGFNDKDQIELGHYYCHLARDLGAKVMLSNSNPHNRNLADNFFHDLYRESNIHEVFASRSINSNGSKRGKITELVITNYETSKLNSSAVRKT